MHLGQLRPWSQMHTSLYTLQGGGMSGSPGRLSVAAPGRCLAPLQLQAVDTIGSSGMGEDRTAAKVNQGTTQALFDSACYLWTRVHIYSLSPPAPQ